MFDQEYLRQYMALSGRLRAPGLDEGMGDELGHQLWILGRSLVFVKQSALWHVAQPLRPWSQMAPQVRGLLHALRPSQAGPLRERFDACDAVAKEVEALLVIPGAISGKADALLLSGLFLLQNAVDLLEKPGVEHACALRVLAHAARGRDAIVYHTTLECLRAFGSRPDEWAPVYGAKLAEEQAVASHRKALVGPGGQGARQNLVRACQGYNAVLRFSKRVRDNTLLQIRYIDYVSHLNLWEAAVDAEDWEVARLRWGKLWRRMEYTCLHDLPTDPEFPDYASRMAEATAFGPGQRRQMRSLLEEGEDLVRDVERLRALRAALTTLS